ncbi:hypothetical protein [uncultured Jatrophihabitans sp.]|uniref:hypothetical protein n=1 Tax=uncultured Jatrophihabitans sp. TaxID=1610747 RepID=UPI0035CAB827
MRLRLALGSAGVLLALFGVFRLLTQVPLSDVLVLGLWLVAAVAIHDGVLSPIVVGVGVLVAKFVPPRARRYVQGALISGALVTAIALPMIHRAYSQPKVKAILQQDFAANLLIILAVIAVASVLLYAVSVARGRR